MKQTITLKEVNYDNYNDLIDLKVRVDQRNFVASNIFSLAEAYAVVASKGYALPFGIYRGDKPVGFLMIGYCPDLEYAKKAFDEDEEIPDFIPGSYDLWRFMIDRRYQQRGYGREALRLALELIKTKPLGEAEYCWLSYEPGNEVARKLYRSFGFEEKELPKGWDEVPAVLKLLDKEVYHGTAQDVF
ncbi:MAG: GNAT family N-acetyltransferase [Clostridia bacterium]|nr:GNAT family N-acetyltransferase [Clostridia bacterium]